MMIDVDAATVRLRQAGLRLTPQRRALLEELAGDTSHPRAETIAARVTARVPGVSLSTVYKGLHELADIGLVRELDVPGATRFDPDTSPHAHLVCESCGTVLDVEVPAAALDLLTKASPVAVSRTEIVLHGTCKACSRS